MLKEHAARALVALARCRRASRTSVPIARATAKTACQKLFSASRTMFLEISNAAFALRRSSKGAIHQPRQILESDHVFFRRSRAQHTSVLHARSSIRPDRASGHPFLHITMCACAMRKWSEHAVVHGCASSTAFELSSMSSPSYELPDVMKRHATYRVGGPR